MGLAAAAIASGPLAWDGAYYLFKALDLQQPFLAPGRLINALLQQPVLLASHVTSDLPTLRAVFSLSYVLVPALSLAAAWSVCRRRPAMFVWPAIGIAVLSLPGRLFFVAESTMATDLAWPVLLALLVTDVAGMDLALLAVFSVLIWLTHPVAIPIFAMFAVVAAVRAWLSPGRRRLLLLSGLFVLLALARAFVPLSPYEVESASIASFGQAYANAVAGAPLQALLLVVAASACFMLQRRAARLVAALLLLAAGVVLVRWAIHPGLWVAALDFRFWQAPLTAALMLLATIDSIRSAPDDGVWQPVVLACAMVFCAVLVAQSWQWSGLSATFSAEVAAMDSVCAPVPDLEGTPLYHWASVPYALILQARSPAHVLVPRSTDCDELQRNGALILADWDTRPAHSGWFNIPP